MSANYIDSRTKEERENEPDSITTHSKDMEDIIKEFRKEFHDSGDGRIGVISKNCFTKTTYEDIEFFILKALSQSKKQIIGEIEGNKMKRQFPLAEKIKDRVYDCEVVSYNQAINDILKTIKE